MYVRAYDCLHVIAQLALSAPVAKKKKKNSESWTVADMSKKKYLGTEITDGT